MFQVYDFTADDMRDLGEIGRGNYGTVNKMQHKKTGTVMAVKVNAWQQSSAVPQRFTQCWVRG